MATDVSFLSQEIQAELAQADAPNDLTVIENNATLAKTIFNDAKEATKTEHSLTPLQGLRMYPRAVLWCIFVSLAVTMDGYDQAYLGSLYAEGAFQKQFGVPYEKGYQVPAKWQSGISNSSSVGVILGILLNGWISERIGMKKTMLVSYVAVVGLTFVLVFATTKPVLLVGELLIGIPFGIFHTTAPAYASEVCPVVLRGYLTSFVNLAAILGQLIAAGVLRGVEGMSGRWAYDIPFALQWIWPIPLFIGMMFCPESPWWLIRKGRVEDAEKSLQRLSSDSAETRQSIAMMTRTTQEEKLTEGSSFMFLDCFQGTNLRRLEIAWCAWGIQTFSGLPLQSYNTYFFETAGLSDSNAFTLSIGYYAIGLIGTILSWFLLTKFGRRDIFLAGLVFMCIVLFAIGFLALGPASNHAIPWAQSVLLVVWVFMYDLTVGPVAWCIASEVSATRLRRPTIAIARNSFYLFSIVWGVSVPYALNPTAGDLKGKTAFIFAATCFLAVVWTFFRLPEMKDRTFEELNILFWKRVPARKFGKTLVDAYAEEQFVNPAVEEVLEKV